MPKSSRITAAEVGIFSVVSCVNNVSAHNPPAMVDGGLLHDILGAQARHSEGALLAVQMGTPKGSLVGGAVGRSMTRSGRLKMCQALKSVRVEVPTSWESLHTDSQYVVGPTHIYETLDGPDREYTFGCDRRWQYEERHSTCMSSMGWQLAGSAIAVQ